MTKPNHDAHQMGVQLARNLMALRSKHSNHPEVRALLHLDDVPEFTPTHDWVLQAVFAIGRGTHDPATIDVKQVLMRGFEVMKAADTLLTELRLPFQRQR